MDPAQQQQQQPSCTWLLAACLAAIAGCPDATRGAGDAPDGGTPTAPNATPPSNEARARSPESGGNGAGDGGADGSMPTDGSIGLDASGGLDGSVSGRNVDRAWAAWPLPPPSPPSANYSVTTDAATDETTKLVWERNVPATLRTWQEAEDYCATLALAGKTDWRLPTRIELWSIVDFAAHTPAIHPVAFPSTPAELFWSHSPDAKFRNSAWTVSFDDGRAGPKERTGAYRVRCVRGG